MKRKSSRRAFLRNTALTAGGFMIVPRHVLGRGYKAPSDKLNIAFIGCGGKGLAHIEAMSKENYVAFCDVDMLRAAESFELYPNVPRYKDFRKMLDERGKDIDAVVISTPDHTHAVAAMASMEMGKHVYVEKPLTHNIAEARQLLDASRKYNIVTQMGNQGASHESNAQLSEWIQGGVIGDVPVVHAWTNRPVWPQGVPTPAGRKRAPRTIDWNLWLGPAPYRRYDPAYAPFKWRGWWDFGTGALGDMGCHLIDPAYRALKLTTPLSAEATATTVWIGDFIEANYVDSCPPSSVVKLEFGSRGTMPATTLWWYDGGIRPMRPVELKTDEPFGSWDGGILFEGTKGKIVAGIFGENPTLLPSSRMKDFKPPAETLKRYATDHQTVWIEACKGNGKASSPFEYAVPLTETLLMGNLAVRCYDLKKLKPGSTPTSWAPYEYPGRVRLDWDTKAMRVTNFEEANRFVSRVDRDF